MIRNVGTQVEKIAAYSNPIKLVFSVLTAGVTVYVATHPYMLKQLIAGAQGGTPITSAAQVELDVVGEVFWKASGAAQVDLLEAGTL